MAMTLIQGHTSTLAWKPSNMLGINLEEMTHKLNVFPDAKLVKQKKRFFGWEKQEAMKDEVEKLGEQGILEKLYIHSG